MRHTANSASLPCALFLSTRQTSTFAVDWGFAVSFLSRHTANITFAVCQTFAVCWFYWHTAQGKFTVCPSLRTWQRLGHTATLPFPLVLPALRNRLVVWWCSVLDHWTAAKFPSGHLCMHDFILFHRNRMVKVAGIRSECLWWLYCMNAQLLAYYKLMIELVNDWFAQLKWVRFLIVNK